MKGMKHYVLRYLCRTSVMHESYCLCGTIGGA